jgi:hypothetical protein
MKNSLILFFLIGMLVLTGGMNSSYAQPSMVAEPHMDTSSNQSVAYLTGKVAETMDSGGYTYINIEGCVADSTGYSWTGSFCPPRVRNE